MSGPEVDFYLYPGAGEGTIPIAARAGGFVFIAGGMAAHPEHGIPEGMAPMEGYPHHWSRVNRELEYIFGVAGPILEAAGSSLRQAMKITSYHTEPTDVFEALRLRREHFGAEAPPPSTLVLVPELPVRDARVAVDMIALRTDAMPPREALATSTPGAPMPPHERIWGYKIYSKAARGGGLIFTSGRTNNVIGGAGDETARGSHDFPYREDRAEATTRMIVAYLLDVLAHFGAGPEHVAKAEIHLDDPRQIAGIETAWGDLFPDDPPARTFIPATFPTRSTIEIEFVAIDPEGPFRRRSLRPHGLPAPVGREAAAVRAGPYVFLSGLMATDEAAGLAEAARVNPAFPYHQSSARLQTALIAERLHETAAELGSSICNVVRRRAMFADLSDIGPADAVWRRRSEGGLPPTTYFKTATPLPAAGCTVQYDIVLWAP